MNDVTMNGEDDKEMILDCSKVTGRFIAHDETQQQWRPIQPIVAGQTTKRRYNRRRSAKPKARMQGGALLMSGASMPRVPVPVSLLQSDQMVASSPKSGDVITSPTIQQPILTAGHQYLIRAAQSTVSTHSVSALQRPSLAFSTPHVFQCPNGTSFQILPLAGSPFQFLNCSTPSQVVLATQPHSIQDILQNSAAKRSSPRNVESTDSPVKISPSLEDDANRATQESSPTTNENNRTESTTEKASLKDDRSSEANEPEDESYVTHVVDGYVIKESRKPFPAIDYTQKANQEEQNAAVKKKRASVKQTTVVTRHQPKRERKEPRQEEKTKESPISKKSRRRSVIESTKDFEEEDPEHWTIDQVGNFVADKTNSAELAEKFRSHEIDGSALLLIKEEFLMQFMDMKLGPALKLCSRIADLRKRTLSVNGTTENKS